VPGMTRRVSEMAPEIRNDSLTRLLSVVPSSSFSFAAFGKGGKAALEKRVFLRGVLWLLLFRLACGRVRAPSPAVATRRFRNSRTASAIAHAPCLPPLGCGSCRCGDCVCSNIGFLPRMAPQNIAAFPLDMLLSGARMWLGSNVLQKTTKSESRQARRRDLSLPSEPVVMR
jgi:hypothetical protein